MFLSLSNCIGWSNPPSWEFIYNRKYPTTIIRVDGKYTMANTVMLSIGKMHGMVKRDYFFTDEPSLILTLGKHCASIFINSIENPYKV